MRKKFSKEEELERSKSFLKLRSSKHKGKPDQLIVINTNHASIALYDKKGKIIDYAMIDKEDVKKIRNYRWYKNTLGYVVYKTVENGKEYCYLLHRVIMDPNKDKLIDHINSNKLDNRKNNLRITDKQGNIQNRIGSWKHSKSGIRNVSFDKKRKIWIARLTFNKKEYRKDCSSIEECQKFLSEKRKEFGYLQGAII